MVPQIRFKGFNGAWEESTLGSLGSFKNGMNFGKEAMGHGHPFVNLQNVFGQFEVDNNKLELAESSNVQRREYSLLKGDVLFIRSSVKHEGVGETALITKTLKDTTYSGFIIRFRPEVMMSHDFNRIAYRTTVVRKQILANASRSANTNINQNALKNIALGIPIFEEQTKIGNYIRELDRLIGLYQRKHEKLVTLKKAMLKKMFPQNGATTPEIRFKGFSTPWEEKKLEELIDLGSGRDYKHLSPGNIPVYGTGGYMLSVDQALSFNENAVGIGRKGTIDKPYLLIAPFWTVDTLFYAVPKDENDLNFIFDIFQQVDWKQKDESTGVPSLSKLIINNVDIFSTTPEEQQKIGTYFRQLDELIEQHGTQLTKLKQIKTACLEKMFV